MSTSTINYIVHDYWQEQADPRSKDYFFMSNGPWKMLTFIGCYIFFVTKIGPQLMKNRQPFELRGVMLAYNIFVAVLNAYFFCAACYYLNYGKDLLDFKFPDRNNITDWERAKARMAYFYVWTKVLDLMDTVFFVLRKKNNQISGLHLYHHSVMPIFGWLVIKITPTSPCMGLFPIVNCLVHVIMYSYYALAALGPKVRRYLWWKKYLTQLQLAQFVVFGIYAIFFVKYQTGYPLGIWVYIGVPQPFLFFYLFWSFYKSSYQKNRQMAIDKQTNGHANGHANSYSNGHANGMTNGHAIGQANGHANGHCVERQHSTGSVTDNINNNTEHLKKSA